MNSDIFFDKSLDKSNLKIYEDSFLAFYVSSLINNSSDCTVDYTVEHLETFYVSHSFSYGKIKKYIEKNYIETQNIDTSTPGGDVFLTIFAATTEEESRTISKNIKWAMQKKFEKGDFMLNYNRFMGYMRDSNHNLVIVPEEAEIVRRIYNEYL